MDACHGLGSMQVSIDGWFPCFNESEFNEGLGSQAVAWDLETLPKVGGSAGWSSRWGKIGHVRWSIGRDTICVISFLSVLTKMKSTCRPVHPTSPLQHSGLGGNRRSPCVLEKKLH